MLQREMDSTVNYGAPLVEQKKGFLESFLTTRVKLKLMDKIPVITRKATHSVSDRVLNTVPKKASSWGWLKYLGRLEMPVQIISIVVLGTLLGAAYAVTMQTGDRQLAEGELSVADSVPATQENISQLEQTPEPVVMQVEPELRSQEIQQQETIFQQVTPAITSLEQDAKPIIESEAIELKVRGGAEADLMLSLNASIDNFPKTVESPTNISPKESASNAPAEDVLDSALNKYDQKIIKKLKRKILLVKQETEKYDQSNLRLEGKLELLTVKNRALSNQLRQLDGLSDSLKEHYQIED